MCPQRTYPRSLTRSSCPGHSSIHPGASSLCSHHIPSCPLIRQQALSPCWTCGTDGRPDGASEMSAPPLPGNCDEEIRIDVMKQDALHHNTKVIHGYEGVPPLLPVLGGQGTVQLLDDTAGGQVGVEGPQVGRPRDGGRGDPPSQQGAVRVFGKSEVPG